MMITPTWFSPLLKALLWNIKLISHSRRITAPNVFFGAAVYLSRVSRVIFQMEKLVAKLADSLDAWWGLRL